jgi:hypothetical protein
MTEVNILQDLFDQKIISIVNVLLENPDKRYTLSEISLFSKVNITTTFRIMNRLIASGIIETQIIGKTKIYQLRKNEKSLFLYKFLKKQGDHIEEFLDIAKNHPRVKKIILEGRNNKEAKLIIIGDFVPSEQFRSAADDIYTRYNFKINFLILSENQFEDMKKIGLFDLSNKMIWDKKISS